MSSISTYVLDLLEEYSFDQEEIELLTRANIIANITSEYVKNKNKNIIEQIVNALEIDKSIRAVVTDTEANVLFDTARTGNYTGKVFVKEEIVEALAGKEDVKRRYEDEAGWFMNAAVPITKEGELVGVVYLSTSVQQISDFLEEIKRSLITISFIVSIMIGLLSAGLATAISAPVEKLTGVIKNMADGNLSQQVKVNGNDEIAQLGMAFNRMSERLSEQEEKRRQFVSNASHELKTPLSSIKILAESLLQTDNMDISIVREFLSDINGQIDRLSRITNKLLKLTKMDISENQIEMSEINVTALINEICTSLSPLANKKDINLVLNLEDDVRLLADEDKIWESIFNILDNSIKYTSPNGQVKIALETDVNGIYITIKDNGIGMPQTEANKIFDRFYRIDKARARETGGTGLGLAIALSAVQLHGGDITVESMEGKGSTFRIYLPYEIV